MTGATRLMTPVDGVMTRDCDAAHCDGETAIVGAEPIDGVAWRVVEVAQRVVRDGEAAESRL